MEDTNLPFKPRDHAEARSFQIGFRGAWFRCKIKEISKRKGEIGHVSEYFDFPDEKLKWTKLYQLPYPLSKKSAEKHRELVLRPSYPPVIKESEMPNASDIADVTVVVNDAWKVGNLVDWWTTGCFWSGKIIELSGDDKAKIELHPPPLGEGSTYDVLLNDVRPSLDWSLEHGWTIPAQDSPPCARIINPMNEVTIEQENTVLEEAEETVDEVMIEQENTVPKEAKETLEGNTNEEHGPIITRKTESSETDTADHLNNGTCPLNSMRPDPLEAAVMDLQECLNKVKRLKALLQFGIASSDTPKDQWEYVYQHGSPSSPK